MTKLTFYPLGNADTCLIELRNGDRMLVDYADMRDRKDDDDKRCDLPTLLSQDLAEAKRTSYRVVAFSHVDNDHICGSSEYFELDHADKYKGGKRKKIETLWVPAAAITEQGLTDESRIIREEARHRLRKNYGIVVFSRPERLKEWFEREKINIDERRHLFVDAGNLVQGFKLLNDGIEVFAHSPHARRTNDRGLEDRNADSLVFQVRFEEGGKHTDVLFASDVTHDVLSEVVDITRERKRDERLHWNVLKVAHHTSYTALGEEKGEDFTKPTDQIKWLLQEAGERYGYAVTSSKPIPLKGTKEDEDVQPPHRQAAKTYKDIAVQASRFLVTMEHPNKSVPQPIVIEITGDGAIKKVVGAAGAASVVSGGAPRAGRK